MRAEAELLKPVLTRLPKYLKLLWALARDPRLSKWSKGLLVAGAAYTVSPVDLIPGFIPVVGQLDDLLVLLYAIHRALRKLPVGAQDELLHAHGLTLTELEQDEAAVGTVLGRVARGALNAAGRLGARGLRLAARGLRAAGRAGAGAWAAWRQRPGQ